MLCIQYAVYTISYGVYMLLRMYITVWGIPILYNIYDIVCIYDEVGTYVL